MKRLLLAFSLMLPVVALAQQPVVTEPTQVDTTSKSASIASTNTFQEVWPASTGNRGRFACHVTNYGSNTMYVYLGTITDATTPKSRRLGANATFDCGSNGIVARDAVNVTGTSGDIYQADQQ